MKGKDLCEGNLDRLYEAVEKATASNRTCVMGLAGNGRFSIVFIEAVGQTCFPCTIMQKTAGSND